MAFSSKVFQGEQIIHDGTPFSATLPPHGQGRGLVLALRTPDGYAGVADSFPSELLIPRSEWQARIQEREERKTRLSDLIDQAGLPCHDQDGISYCWIHAPTHCVEVVRVVQNQPMVLLSATSVGCKIKNFRNQGGWGKEGLEYIVERGVVPQALWPENQLKSQYDKPEAWQEAKKYMVSEWWELQPRNLEQQISCLLRNIPIAGGFNFWAHEVTLYEPVWLDGTVAIRFRNSWSMNWGSKGYSILQGSKMLSDDSVCPRVAVAA